MTEQDVQNWLDNYGTAWTEGDPDQVVALFASTAIYQETPFDAPLKGHDGIRAYWQDGAASAQQDVGFSSQVWAIRNNMAVAGWQASFTRRTSGVRVDLNGAFRLTFQSGPTGLLCRSLQEWWHRKET